MIAKVKRATNISYSETREVFSLEDIKEIYKEFGKLELILAFYEEEMEIIVYDGPIE